MGSLDWEVSALGMGCMRLPAKRFNRFKAEEKNSIQLIRHGIDQGINYIDTAFYYHLGDSEKIVGKALKNGYREKVRLVTKLPMHLVRKPEDFEGYLERQLKRLKDDCIDIYLFHALDRNQFEKVEKFGLIEKMEKAKERGLIRHIGFSFHDTLPVFKKIIDYYSWDMAQIQYNYMDTGIQAGTEGLKYGHKKGIAMVIMEPLKGGKLVNPPAEAMQIMKEAKKKRTPVEWGLQFLWDMPEVATVLSGMGSRQMIDENCASADNSGIDLLDREEKKMISRLAQVYKKKIPVQCTSCNYCMPCPSGVNIPENFAILNNTAFESTGLMRWWTKRKYRKLTGSKKKLDKNNPNGNAAICTECNICLEKCPQSIEIPDELKKVDAILGKGRQISDYYKI